MILHHFATANMFWSGCFPFMMLTKGMEMGKAQRITNHVTDMRGRMMRREGEGEELGEERRGGRASEKK